MASNINQSDSDEAMTDCPLLQDFLLTTNLQTIDPTQYSVLMGTSCCDSTYLTCDNGRITEIVMNDLGMGGNIGSFQFPSALFKLEM